MSSDKKQNQWAEKKLGDEIELCYGKGLIDKERKSGKIPVFGSNGIIGFHNTPLVEGPGVIIGRKGSVGEVKFSTTDFWAIDTTYFLKLKNMGDIRFWYYFLLYLQLNKMNSHSAVPGLNRDTVYEIRREIPEFPEQHAIANLLAILDSKTELNQRMNRTLEAVGQAVFKHWFVDFEFPNEEGKPYKSTGGKMVYNEELNSEVPEGWEVKPINEIADFLNGLALQKYPAREGEEYLPVIKIRELRQGITESSDKANLDVPKEYIVGDGDILFSWSGSLEVVIWGFGKGALNQHLFKVTSQKYPKWFFYYWLLRFLPEYRAIASDKATTMGHIQRHHLSASKVVVPDEKTLEKMDKVLSPITERRARLQIESRFLAEIRDCLLPKLMSGKIRVPISKENVEAS